MILRRIWNHLRTWWLRRQAPRPPAATVRVSPALAPTVRPPKPPMHWATDAHGLPLCGRPLPALWTRDFGVATCEECRRLGLPIITKWRLNSR